MEAKKEAIYRRLITLQKNIDEFKESESLKDLHFAKTEFHILTVFYNALDDELKRNPGATHTNLKIDNKTLKRLPRQIKTSIVCLTEGICIE